MCKDIYLNTGSWKNNDDQQRQSVQGAIETVSNRDNPLEVQGGSMINNPLMGDSFQKNFWVVMLVNSKQGAGSKV